VVNKGGIRKSDEPSGEAESLLGRINLKEMGILA